EIMCKQPIARLAAEALDVDARPIGERPRRAHGVNAADEATDPFERLAIFELRRAPAAARIHREAESAGCVQRLAVDREGRDHRNLALRELEREGGLLEDLRVGPARG